MLLTTLLQKVINEPQENPLMRSQIEKPALMSPFQTVPAADKK
jgi:hypothetical protein